MKKKSLVFFMMFCFLIIFNTTDVILADNQDIDIIQEDNVAADYLTPLLKALKDRDKISMYSLFVFKEEKSADKFFEQLFEVWNERDFTSAKKVSEKKRNAKGDTHSGTTYQYSVTSGTEEVRVEFTVADGTKEIDQIRIVAEPQIIPKQYYPVQLLMAALAIVEFLFTLYTAFLCIKRKPKLWGIWLVGILVMYGGIAFTTKGELVLSFFMRTFEFSKIVFNQNRITQISISVPIVAVVYWIKYRQIRIHPKIKQDR